MNNNIYKKEHTMNQRNDNDSNSKVKQSESLKKVTITS